MQLRKSYKQQVYDNAITLRLKVMLIFQRIFLSAYARDHQPCIIFMDEIDAIGEYFLR